MNSSGKTVIIYNFLDVEEAQELAHNLKSSGIDSLIQQMGSERTDPDYQVLILERDMQKAIPIIERFKKKLIDKLKFKNSTKTKFVWTFKKILITWAVISFITLSLVSSALDGTHDLQLAMIFSLVGLFIILVIISIVFFLLKYIHRNRSIQ